MFNNQNQGNENKTQQDEAGKNKLIAIFAAILIVGIIFVVAYSAWWENGEGKALKTCDLGHKITTKKGVSVWVDGIVDNETLYYYNALFPLNSGYVRANENFITITLNIENVGKESVYVSPLDFKLIMEGDYEYEYNSLFSDSGIDIAPMQKESFQVTFETVLKSAAAKYTLQYNQIDLMDGNKYYFKLYQ